MSFKSPSTGSEYKVLLENKHYILCYRKVENDRYRARIQIKGNASVIDIKNKLKFASSWGYKDSHFSVLTDAYHLRYAVTDAFQAIFNSVPLDEKEYEDKVEKIFEDTKKKYCCATTTSKDIVQNIKVDWPIENLVIIDDTLPTPNDACAYAIKYAQTSTSESLKKLAIHDAVHDMVEQKEIINYIDKTSPF